MPAHVLEPCRVCHADVSESAKACPNCGASGPTEKSFFRPELTRIEVSLAACLVGVVLTYAYMTDALQAPWQIIAAILAVGGGGFFAASLLRYIWLRMTGRWKLAQ